MFSFGIWLYRLLLFLGHLIQLSGFQSVDDVSSVFAQFSTSPKWILNHCVVEGNLKQAHMGEFSRS